MRLVVAALSMAAGVALLSCSSATHSPPAKFSEIYGAMFPRSAHAQCEFCHALPANEKSNGLLSTGMDRATAYSALVGKSSTSTACGGRQYAVPGNPEASLLYQKLSAPPCGDHMPLGGDALSSDQLEMVHSWIADGAKND